MISEISEMEDVRFGIRKRGDTSFERDLNILYQQLTRTLYEEKRPSDCENEVKN